MRRWTIFWLVGLTMGVTLVSPLAAVAQTTAPVGKVGLCGADRGYNYKTKSCDTSGNGDFELIPSSGPPGTVFGAFANTACPPTPDNTEFAEVGNPDGAVGEGSKGDVLLVPPAPFQLQGSSAWGFDTLQIVPGSKPGPYRVDAICVTSGDVPFNINHLQRPGPTSTTYFVYIPMTFTLCPEGVDACAPAGPSPSSTPPPPTPPPLPPGEFSIAPSQGPPNTMIRAQSLTPCPPPPSGFEGVARAELAVNAFKTTEEHASDPLPNGGPWTVDIPSGSGSPGSDVNVLARCTAYDPRIQKTTSYFEYNPSSFRFTEATSGTGIGSGAGSADFVANCQQRAAAAGIPSLANLCTVPAFLINNLGLGSALGQITAGFIVTAIIGAFFPALIPIVATTVGLAFLTKSLTDFCQSYGCA